MSSGIYRMAILQSSGSGPAGNGGHVRIRVTALPFHPQVTRK